MRPNLDDAALGAAVALLAGSIILLVTGTLPFGWMIPFVACSLILLVLAMRWARTSMAPPLRLLMVISFTAGGLLGAPIAGLTVRGMEQHHDALAGIVASRVVLEIQRADAAAALRDQAMRLRDKQP